MIKKRTTLEVIAPTVAEAIAKGLGDLGLPKDEVDIDVLDEGGRGLFGLGSRQARVRLTVKASMYADESQSMESAVEQTGEEQKVTVWYRDEPEIDEGELEIEALESHPSSAEAIELDYLLEIARDTVSELLKKMKVVAQVTAHMDENGETQHRPTVYVDIHGKDLSILIGRQAETLNALQYISSLIVGKELGRSITMVLDVEGYRKRREQQLRQLARRMADQAMKTGRRQVLEPMPANERRLIHIELRDNSKVKTESIGEEPRRKVTIIPL